MTDWPWHPNERGDVQKQVMRLREILKDVTYKRGYRTSATYFGPSVCLQTVVVFPSIVPPHEPIEITFNDTLEWYNLERLPDADVVKFFITNHYRRLELHEMDEWFRYKGQLVKDPHVQDRS